MLLTELFGENARVKILEELISNWDYFLSVEEISRMSDVSKKTVYKHIRELENLNMLILNTEDPKKFKLNPEDKRAIALALIETEEYIRRTNKYEKEFKNNDFEGEISIPM